MELLQLLAFGDGGWGDELLAGLEVTVMLALATLPFGLSLGFMVALGKNSSEPSLVIATNIYTTIFRGLPELLTLFIVYYGGQIVLQYVVGLFTDAYIEVNGFAAGMVALGLVFSAYSSEVFVGAFRAIDKGQAEAGATLGLTKKQIMRLIISPQLLRIALPGLSNLWLILLKETSLVSIIALDDLIRRTGIAVGFTKQPLFFYSVAALIYLVLSIISTMGLNKLDNRLHRGLSS